MIVQAINAGTTVVQNDQFNLLVPGARVGDGSGCTAQWGSTSNWGSLNDGIYDRNGCNNLPDKLKGGCNWYFDWFKVRYYDESQVHLLPYLGGRLPVNSLAARLLPQGAHRH